MQRIKLPQIQGHYLTLALKNSILALEIEEESSGRVSFLNIHEDSVYEETNGFFETLEDLFEGLKSAANRNYPEITLQLSKEELSYIAASSLSLASDQVEYRFNLKLTEKRVEKVEVIERQCREKFDLEIRKYQENAQVLYRETERVTQKLRDLEKLHENLKASIISKPDFYFNPDSVSASSFKLTEKRKTAAAIHAAHDSIELLPQIPSSGMYCFSFKINKTKNNLICFGIINEAGNEKRDESQHNYRYWIVDGGIHGKTSQPSTMKGPFGGKDSIIKMVVDTDQGTLTFLVDDRQVNSCNICKSEKYFAFINLGDIEDSVTII